MKNLTIRTKITLWFIVILNVIVGLSYAMFWFSSESVLRNMVLSDLQDTVDYNVDQVVCRRSPKAAEKHMDSRFVKYGDVYLQIDDDFIELMSGVGTGLFDPDGNLIWGEDLISDVSAQVPFKNRQLETVTSGPDTFLIYDRKLKLDDVGILWMRGSVDQEQRHEEISMVFRFSLFLLPLLILLAAASGYLIIKRSLKPIDRMVEAAGSISTGSDLKRRIDMGEGRNEIQQLAGSFNGMMQRLDEAFESEKQFTSDVSHELRTPMAAIMAQCELALDQEDLTPEEAKKALELIHRQGGRMNDMISDMLTYSRIDRRHESYPFGPVDLTALTEEVCEEFAALHSGEAVLETVVDRGVEAWGSDILLDRLLTNLLENAARYGKARPQVAAEPGRSASEDAPGRATEAAATARIRVSLTQADDEIRLCVEDQGMGIPEEHQKRIFDRFYQVDPSRNGEGSGLGLAIVREIARIHNGSISLRSAPGEGSAFTVSLPALFDLQSV